jgi:Phage tail protein
VYLFTKALVTNSRGNVLTLQLGDLSNGIEVRDVSGLDPVKATLVSSSFAGQDGEIYQSSRRGPRNITMKLGIQEVPGVSTLLTVRRSIYSIFRPKDQVTLKFYVDDTDDLIEDGYQIVGRVESCQSPMFSQDPEVDISILCFDPDFIDPVEVLAYNLTSVDVNSTYFPYAGTVETGFAVTISVHAAISAFSLIYKDPGNMIWTMDVAYPFLVGDFVKIITTPGIKEATLTRGGTQSSILYAVSPQSTWAKFAPGDNHLQLSVPGDVVVGGSISATVAYLKRFGEL